MIFNIFNLDASPIGEPWKTKISGQESKLGAGSRLRLETGQGGVKLTAEREEGKGFHWQEAREKQDKNTEKSLIKYSMF